MIMPQSSTGRPATTAACASMALQRAFFSLDKGVSVHPFDSRTREALFGSYSAAATSLAQPKHTAFGSSAKRARWRWPTVNHHQERTSLPAQTTSAWGRSWRRRRSNTIALGSKPFFLFVATQQAIDELDSVREIRPASVCLATAGGDGNSSVEFLDVDVDLVGRQLAKGTFERT